MGIATACRISIIVPTLDEAPLLAANLNALQPFRKKGAELIVVDGGSKDGTLMMAAGRVDRALCSERGRATQMNAGARVAEGDVLLFLHADTRLPADACEAISRGLERTGRRWGRFDVRLSGRQSLLRLVESLMNVRSRVSGIATGDQAVFVERRAFEQVGGFPSIPLMEDIALSRRLKVSGPPLCLRQRVTTSSRRWERHGIVRTILVMWRLRLAFALGGDPHRLARQYYRAE